MNKTKIAILFTFVWIACGVGLICLRIDSVKDMPLNSMGDFLAGFFSPLAFLWLVIGYFQQGEELKLNTKALELQVHELRQSVVQQQELVAVTRADMALSKQAYERELEQAVRQAQPIFSLDVKSFSGGTSPEIVNIQTSITNNGHTAINVKIDSNFGIATPKEFAVLASNEEQRFQFSVSTSLVHEVWLHIHFVDGQGTLRHQAVSLVKSEETGWMNFSLPQEFVLTDV